MKTSFLFYIIAFLIGCSGERSGLRVSGVYDKGINVNVCLIARDEAGTDTLVNGDLVNGYFSISTEKTMTRPVFVEIYQKGTKRCLSSLRLPRGEGSYLTYLNLNNKLNWLKQDEREYEVMDSLYQNENQFDIIARELRNCSSKIKKEEHDSLANILGNEIDTYHVNTVTLMNRHVGMWASAIMLVGRVNVFASGVRNGQYALQRSLDSDKYFLQEWDWLMDYCKNNIDDNLRGWLTDRSFFSRLGKNSKSMQVMRVNRLMDVGQKAPDFSMLGLDGKSFRFYDAKAKLKYLDFWSSLCVWCRADMPEVKKIYNEFKDKGFEVIAVSLDYHESAWKKAIEQDKQDWTYAGLWERNLASLVYGVASLPTTFLLDENNNIIGKNLHGDELREAIRKYLK